jgi:23S rRNA (cytosine1962-C5)-methyltransferase
VPVVQRSADPVRRRAGARIPSEVALRIRSGHPWIYREALKQPATGGLGDLIVVVDDDNRFVARALLDPEQPIALRVLSLDEREELEGTLRPEDFVRRLRPALRLRRAWIDPATTDAYRIINGEGDGLPGLIVDTYAGYLVVQMMTGAWLKHAEALYDALITELSPRGIYEQRRFRPAGSDAPRGPAELVRGTAADVDVEVKELGVKLLVDVRAPMGTGIFLDMRETRQKVGALSRDREVLNCFAYTGGFSVHAALGGAKKVVSVDLAHKALHRARQNFSLNGLDPERHEFIAQDVFNTLERMAAQGRGFDLVVLDPPTFSTSKTGVFTALKDYEMLAEAAMRVLRPGGLLLAASNAAKLDLDDFRRALGNGSRRAGLNTEVGGGPKIIGWMSLPPDFPVPPAFGEGSYLKCALLARP